MRTIRSRLGFLSAALALAACAAVPVAAQGTAADTALAAKVQQQITVLKRDKTAPKYSAAARDSIARLVASHLRAPITQRPPADTAVPIVTLPPPPSADSSAIGRLLGPVTTSAAMRALGGVYAQYEDNFVTFDEQQWAANGASWAHMNYYDRALIYYAWHRRTGDAKYLQRANAIAVDYRKGYLEPNNYAIQAHWSMMDGLAAHYLATGDTMSKIAVGKVADLFIGLTYRDNIGGKTTTDNRVQARYLVSLLLAHSIKAPSLGIGAPVGIPGGHDWAAELRRALPLILSTQDADGAWRLSDCGDGGPLAVHPFTTGLLLDALGRYYDTFDPDPRILAAVKRGADYLWAKDWIPVGTPYVDANDGQTRQSVGAFRYVERLCPSEGGPGPAPDLNNLILPAYAWLYARTGDAAYQTRARAIFSGAVSGAWISPAKAFNQVYASSYRYLNQVR